MDISVRNVFPCFSCCKTEESEPSKKLETIVEESVLPIEKKSCLTTLLSYIPIFNCCGKEADEDDSPSKEPSSPVSSSTCFQVVFGTASEVLDQAIVSISLIVFSSAAELKESAVTRNSSFVIKFGASLLLSAASLVTVPLALIEGVARRFFGWTLSLLNRVLPFGNDLLTGLNKTLFSKAVRNHLLISFVAFDHIFDIFAPNTYPRNHERIENHSVFLRLILTNKSKEIVHTSHQEAIPFMSS
ncbi:MAG: hypothetical protein FJZ59_00860 [Chlamydiae bacterium]|nr:hypothetical protein [Chlamydiota bacterium]